MSRCSIRLLLLSIDNQLLHRVLLFVVTLAFNWWTLLVRVLLGRGPFSTHKSLRRCAYSFACMHRHLIQFILRFFRFACTLYIFMSRIDVDILTGTVNIDPATAGLRCVTLHVHGLEYKDAFWYTKSTTIHDLQHHVREWFHGLSTKDTFKLVHSESNRFQILNTQDPKVSIRLPVIPRNYLIPVSGGGIFKEQSRGRKRHHSDAEPARKK